MAKDKLSNSEIERLARQINAAGLKKRWEEVVCTSASQAKTAPPGLRDSWLRANEEAKKVVAALDLAVKAETVANRVWRAATAAERGAVRPVLRLVDGGAGKTKPESEEA